MAKPTTAQIDNAGQAINPRVVSSIHKASEKSGISFEYLMAQAARESNFDHRAAARVSSAAGLYQFTKGTWLELMSRHGADHGHADLASKISRTKDGEWVVADAGSRQKIMDLRRDPDLSAAMAGEYAKANKATLEKRLGREVGTTDLYLAHFLGPNGAVKLLKAKEADGGQAAAAVLPTAARRNPTIFYESRGQNPRNVAAVYQRIADSLDKPMRQYAALRPETPAAPATPEELARAAEMDPWAGGGPTLATLYAMAEQAAQAEQTQTAQAETVNRPDEPMAAGTHKVSLPMPGSADEPAGAGRTDPVVSFFGALRRSLFGEEV